MLQMRLILWCLYLCTLMWTGLSRGWQKSSSINFSFRVRSLNCLKLRPLKRGSLGAQCHGIGHTACTNWGGQDLTSLQQHAAVVTTIVLNFRNLSGGVADTISLFGSGSAGVGCVCHNDVSWILSSLVSVALKVVNKRYSYSEYWYYFIIIL